MFNKENMTRIILGLFILLTLSSCGKFFGKPLGWELSEGRSTTTGWAYNDPKYGGFQTSEVEEQGVPVGMVPIEGGVFDYGQSDENIVFSNDVMRRRVSISSFYMDQYEVTNRAWREYLHWLSLIYGSTNPEIIQEAHPDVTVWRSELSYNEPMLENYFTHNSYSHYPVVGVSWEQAVAYCEWRTDRVNEGILHKKGLIELPDFKALNAESVFTLDRYLNSPEYKSEGRGRKGMTDAFGNPRKVSFSDGVLLPRFRLPLEVEWEYAAYAIISEKGTNNYNEKRVLPWSGHSLRSPARKTAGVFLANFVRGKGDYMGQAGSLNDGSIFPQKVDAYQPNDFGLYNMAGNVNEWVADLYRPMNTSLVDDYNSYRGVVFTQAVRDANGELVYDAQGRIKQEIIIDSLENGGIQLKDYSNYKDGDGASSINRDYWNRRGVDKEEETKAMYGGELGTAEGLLSTGLSNSIRIYKGGSWADRVYWLNPGVKRYLDQKKSSSQIGFRCAMDRIAPAKSLLSKKKW